MTYDVIAYIIVALAFVALLRNIIQFFINIPGKTKGSTSKCAGCNSSCEISELRSHQDFTVDSKNTYQMKL